MDPVTQGLLGAAAAQTALTHQLGRRTWLYGAVGGMAADLDVLIRSDVNPLVSWVYHRHFTHSIAFAPIGGLLVALAFLLVPRNRDHKRPIIAATMIGYATHGLLDALTSYGTLLAWPLSTVRVAWDLVAIIDPIYTLILAVAVVLAAKRRSRRAAAWGLALSSAYLGLCGVQKLRAHAAITELANHRGHDIERVRVMPEPLTNIIWRSIYQYDDSVAIDRVRVPWWSTTTVYEGTRAPLLHDDELPAPVIASPELMDGVATFRWFTDGWVVEHSRSPLVLGDLRYSMTVDEPVPLWGLEIHPHARHPFEQWSPPRDTARLFARWLDVLRGEPPR